MQIHTPFSLFLFLGGKTRYQSEIDLDRQGKERMKANSNVRTDPSHCVQ